MYADCMGQGSVSFWTLDVVGQPQNLELLGFAHQRLRARRTTVRANLMSGRSMDRELHAPTDRLNADRSRSSAIAD